MTCSGCLAVASLAAANGGAVAYVGLIVYRSVDIEAEDFRFDHISLQVGRYTHAVRLTATRRLGPDPGRKSTA
ncbi:hypothetical protein SAMN06265347_103134 [Halobellus salinus]|nr:hypothetical protein SAMN06265347_103134 [Halobellus salinus]